MIRRQLRDLWPDVSGQSVLGLGYTTPYLTSFRGEASRVIAAMPAQQGVLHWPSDDPGLTTLVDELYLPFDDVSMDRILLVHAVECAEQISPLLREAWRVLAGSGRLIVVVPNRRGIWTRFERTPFGRGLPYSTGQVSRLLRDNMFTPIKTHRALYVPPSSSGMILSIAPALEQIGPRLISTFAGVIVVEAVKQIYAGQPTFHRARNRSVLALPQRTQRSTSVSLPTRQTVRKNQ